MSSSKIFKKTSSFIPKKIIPQRKKEESGWKSITIPADQQGAASFAAGEYDHFQRPHSADGFFGTNRGEHLESAHKTDFSTPDTSPKAFGEPESSSSGINPSISPNTESTNLESAQEEAYNKGVRDGLKRASDDFGSSTQALIMACEQINTLRETILNNSMAEMQNLVLIIAEKIIRHSVTEQDRTIIDTVEESIRQAVKSDEFLVQVNPADLDVIKEKSKEFIGSLSGLENIIVQANPAIDRGGCRIDSSTSTVDATIAGQLQIIKDTIKGKI